MDHRARLKALSRSLDQERLDLLLVSHLPNVRYLCGFTGSAALLLVNATGATLFTDGRYIAQAREEVNGARVVICRKPLLVAVGQWLTTRRRTVRPLVVGIDPEHLTVAAHRQLAKTLDGRARVKLSPPLVERARMIKDAEEVVQLRQAVQLGCSLFDTVLKTVRPGIKETDVAAAMEFKARQSGAEAMSFETIIASGDRSALPHGRASTAPIPASGFVVCDFGVILGGYCSDMTRTMYVGHPRKEARGFYDAVREAQQAAVEAVRPGRQLGEVDRAARKMLKTAGLDRYFTHSTGHGVGIEIHEPPRIAAGQDEVLRPGMVITIEPGAYVPTKWGVRIEDMVLVTERGVDVLTRTTKDLICI
jgi:Xaa-Pro aminopeptidase